MAEPSERVKSILRRWRRAEMDKSSWNQHWEDLARVQLPSRQGFVTTINEGERLTDDLYDGTPMSAAIGLANAVGGMLRPDGEQWFYIRTDSDALNEAEESQVWLQDTERRLMRSLNNPKSRFRQSSGEVDLMITVLGTGCQYIGESKDLNRLSCSSLHLKDVTIIFGDEGNPEGAFIVRNRPIRDLISRFGIDSLSDPVKQKLQGDLKFEVYDEKLRVLHAVLPRQESRAESLLARDLPYTDIWIEIDNQHEVYVGGFHEFPFVCPRWDTTSGETYGRSPGMVALPDSDTLQAQGETFLVAGQRAADPPWAVPDDSSVTDINSIPGGLAYYSPEAAAAVRGNPFFPMMSGANIPLTREMQMDTREQIRIAFYKNVLNLPVEGPQMTATEVIQRKQEFIREMGPVFSRLESDYPAPQVERAFSLQLRAGGFAPVPRLLQGRNVRFEFESPITKIRQQVDAAAARLWVQELVALGAVRPEALHLINVEGYGRFVHSAARLPKSIIASPDEFANNVARDQQAAAQAQQLAMVQQGAEIANTASGAAQQAVAAQGAPS